MKQETRKKIFKNYLIVGLSIILTIFVMTYLVTWYAEKSQQTKRLTIADTMFSELNSNDLNNYLVENPNVLIYIGSSVEDKLVFENNLKELVNDYYLKDMFVYLDTAKINDDTFYTDVYKNLFSEELKKEMALFTGYTNIIYVVDGEFQTALYLSKTEPKATDVKDFLEENEIILVNND